MPRIVFLHPDHGATVTPLIKEMLGGHFCEVVTMVLVETKVNLVPAGSALTGMIDQSFFQFRRSAWYLG